MNNKRIGMLVLAAGCSSRMGRPKQLLHLEGKTFVRRVAETSIAAGGRPVVIVTGAAAQEVSSEVGDLPIQLAHNPSWRQGIGASIRTGMIRILQIEPNLDAVIVMLCDQPDVSAATLDRLIGAHVETGKPLCAASFGQTIAPPALFARQFFDELLSIPPQQGARQILLDHVADLLRIYCPEAQRDIDTPDDYDVLCATSVPASSVQK